MKSPLSQRRDASTVKRTCPHKDTQTVADDVLSRQQRAQQKLSDCSQIHEDCEKYGTPIFAKNTCP